MGVQEEYPVLTPEVRDSDEPCGKQIFKHFIGAIYECTKIQAEHPFCVEGDPNWNPVMCAVVLNKCLAEELGGILNIC